MPRQRGATEQSAARSKRIHGATQDLIRNQCGPSKMQNAPALCTRPKAPAAAATPSDRQPASTGTENEVAVRAIRGNRGCHARLEETGVRVLIAMGQHISRNQGETQTAAANSSRQWTLQTGRRTSKAALNPIHLFARAARDALHKVGRALRVAVRAQLVQTQAVPARGRHNEWHDRRENVANNKLDKRWPVEHEHDNKMHLCQM